MGSCASAPTTLLCVWVGAAISPAAHPEAPIAVASANRTSIAWPLRMLDPEARGGPPRSARDFFCRLLRSPSVWKFPTSRPGAAATVIGSDQIAAPWRLELGWANVGLLSGRAARGPRCARSLAAPVRQPGSDAAPLLHRGAFTHRRSGRASARSPGRAGA